MSNVRFSLPIVIALAAMTAMSSACSRGSDKSADAGRDAAAATQDPSSGGAMWGANYFPNVPLVSMNGEKVKFFDDLVKDKVVAINFIYTKRGAFTGAHKTKVGLIESADGGTFFLDEVGEMPPSLQVKLLRVLEQKQVMKIGALRPRSIDVRFIAATNRDLEAEVSRGAFRRDLYYRLAAATVLIPPLRDRRHEIVGLANRFIAQSHTAAEGREVPRLSAEAREVLETYAWPGNIRELRNVVERAVLLCRDGRIRPEHLPREKMGRVLPTVLAKVVPSNHLDLTQLAPEHSGSSQGRERSTDASSLGYGPPESGRLGERDSVVSALAQCAGNQTQAARVLGVSRRTLVKRLEEFALPRPRKQMP